MHPMILVEDIALARISSAPLPFHASLSDHLPQHHIDALAPEGTQSEFG